MKIHKYSSLAGLFVALLGSGCTYLGGKGEVLDIQELALEFWDIEQTTDARVENPRIAIVEFTVEYVPAPVDLSRSMRLELPGVLYQGFVRLLPEFDRQPIPLDSVSGSAAYQSLSGTRIEDVGLGETVRYPVDGLVALGETGDVDAKLLKVLEDTNADVALQVRLRVGVRDGRASIEKGSILRGLGTAGSAFSESKLTLVSHRRVIAEEDTDSGLAPVDSSEYAEAIRGLFRPYIGLALIASGRS